MIVLLSKLWRETSNHPVKRLVGAFVLALSILLVLGAIAFGWLAIKAPEETLPLSGAAEYQE